MSDRDPVVHQRLRISVVVMMCVATQAAHAASWQVCDLKVRVLAHHRSAHEIEVVVLRVTGKPSVECPAKNSRLRFTPEAADYQSDLPHKQWPKAGEVAAFRYQYLDGICKERAPCRIRHYPVSR